MSIWKRSAVLLWYCVTTLCVATPQVITNPVAPVGHDPWVIQHEGMYYYCYSHRGAIWVNASRVLQDAVQFNGRVVWRPVRGTAYSRELWAPELHRLQGRWYIYVAADDGENRNHRMIVLENGTNNAQGAYTFKGKISDPSDKWAIDGTVLEHAGRLYFIWSGWPGDENVQQDLYIACMKDPWTIDSERVRISTPEHDWERIGRPLINEGPQVLKHQGRVFVIYSASGSWTDHYCLGQLTLTGTDPLQAKAWQKKPTPVFSGTATVISPGHASFTKSPDGTEDWIVYHTARHQGAGWNRQTRMQRFGWDSQGRPDFGVPISSGVEFPAPSGSLREDATRAQDPSPGPAAAKRYFVIRVVDKQTRRGVPLIELRTVNNIRYVTDSQGIIAFYEPGLMDRDVFFFVEGHGYTFPKDGFGMQGRALNTQPGHTEVLEVERVNLAERLYRVTGQGIYRDSVLAGLPVPVKQPLLNGQVMGQDSVFTCQYQGRVFWFWGDTNRPAYPLGHFATSGAVSDLPGQEGLDPEQGVDLSYFVDDSGFSRPMAPLKEGGLVWLDGIMVVPDRHGHERMVARFARHQSLAEVLERGFMVYNDETQRFQAVVRSGLDLLPFRNTGHAFPVRVGERKYCYFTSPSPVGVRLRVRALYEHAIDPNAYEVLSAQGATHADQPGTVKDPLAQGPGPYRWQRFGDLLRETELPKAQLIQTLEEEVMDVNVYDIETGKVVIPHNGTVYYNDFRRRWISVFCQQFGTTSALGETWFAEADTPIGPWAYARKIITHDKYSFYNPKHHVLFDQDQGRRIFIEGTYSHTFSGTPARATPRYDYNQIMYGLDLDDPRLALPVPVYRLCDGAYLLGGDIDDAGLWDQVESIPFFVPAPERATDDLLPVYATKCEFKGMPVTRLTTAPPDPAGPVLFYALQVGHPTGDSVMSAPLYEYHDADSGRYAYGTDLQAHEGNWQRSREPLCQVWKTPAGLAGTSDSVLTLKAAAH